MNAPLDHVPDNSARETDSITGRLVAWSLVLATVVVLTVLFLWMTEARAHDAPATVSMPLGWKYPYSCCSDKDCKPASDVEVREVVKGYLMTVTSEVVPYGDKRIKDSPDGSYHTCQVAGDFAKGRVLCLFVPPRSY